jgi:hypothetical protein
VREAYDEAVNVFTTSLTKGSKKKYWLEDKSDILQVQEAVLAAKNVYETKSHASKARLWLTRLSSRIIFYSSVMDIMAQYNPEYVGLAWGTMKFFLIVCTPILFPLRSR